MNLDRFHIQRLPRIRCEVSALVFIHPDCTCFGMGDTEA